MEFSPGRYDDYAELLKKSTRAEILFLAIIRGIRGNGASSKASVLQMFDIPNILRACAADLAKGAYPSSPYDPLLRPIHTETFAQVSCLIVIGGYKGTSVATRGDRRFIDHTLPDFLKLAALDHETTLNSMRAHLLRSK